VTNKQQPDGKGNVERVLLLHCTAQAHVVCHVTACLISAAQLEQGSVSSTMSTIAVWYC
jgi:hypothetical protein